MQNMIEPSDWENRIDELSEVQIKLVKQLSAIRQIRMQMKIRDFYYKGSEDFLLQHGLWFDVQQRKNKKEFGIPKYCFYNAIRLACSDRKLFYVEGVAIGYGGILAVEHAWNTNKNGDLIDITWKDKGIAYLGVIFPKKMAKRAIIKGANVLGNYRNNYALFKKPWNASF